MSTNAVRLNYLYSCCQQLSLEPATNERKLIAALNKVEETKQSQTEMLALFNLFNCSIEITEMRLEVDQAG